MYDPRSCGAKCDVCPLKGSVPVPPETNYGANIAVVGEFPSQEDIKEGRPFVGESGRELQRSLASAGIYRRNLMLTTAIACQPPGNDLAALTSRTQAENRRITKRNKQKEDAYNTAVKFNPTAPAPDLEPLIPSPAECCAPRLKHDLGEYKHIIALGGLAARAVMQAPVSIMTVRGSMVERQIDEIGPIRKIMPTFHPTFVLHAKRYSHVFRSDLHRANRWFSDRLAWIPPRLLFHPSPEQLKTFLMGGPNYYTFDLETDSIEPLTAKIRCVGIGTPDGRVVVVGLLGKDGKHHFYPPHEEAVIIEILKEFFTNKKIVKVAHNGGSYDNACLNASWGVEAAPLMDTIILHRLVESELPHNLGFIGSLYTDCGAWKQDREGRKIAIDAETDDELFTYCANDVMVTSIIMPALFERVKIRGQAPLVKIDHKLQRICAGMHRLGMYVDQGKRLSFEQKFVKKAQGHLYTLRQIAKAASGREDFNPGSVVQVRDILFDKWRLVPPVEEKARLTESGDPSAGDAILRSMLTLPELEPDQLKFLINLRMFRKCQKLLGTYIVKLRGSNQLADLGWDEDESEEEAAKHADDRTEREELRAKYGVERTGIVNPLTGRMHPGYNCHGTVTGRLSSSRPLNAQNFPKALRAMVVPQAGHVFIGADADQIELRIAAARWGAKRYLRAFDAMADPHSSTALAVFGDRFQNATGFPGGRWDGDLFIPSGVGKWTGDAYEMRRLAKVVQYASQYMATVETVHDVLRKTEQANDDGTTTLPYLNLAIKETRKMHEAWLANCPEFPVGWEREISEYRRNGYLKEPITGRRRDFLDGENPNELVNFNIQASAAAVINLATIRLIEEFPFEKYGPNTGLINQCHDALVLEVPADGAFYNTESKSWVVPPDSIPAKTMKLLEECMNLTHESLPGVRITATADIGASWKDVG